jgi:RHS repeat-associated protein
VRPLGGSFELEYEREGNEVLLAEPGSSEPSIDMPTNQWVLAKVTLDDEVGPTEYIREFRHRRAPNVLTDPDNRGTGFYDRNEREIYGYSLTLSTREDGSTIETETHNQDYYRRGLVEETLERASDGLLFVRQQFQYRDAPEAGFQGSFFPAEELRTTSWYEGSTTDPDAPGKSTREHRDWDERGNLKSFIEENDDGPEDDLRYTIGYHFEEGPYINKANSVEAHDHQNVLLRKRTATYEPATGALDTLTNVVIGGINPETGAPYSGADATNSTWDFDYDDVGNLFTVTDPREFVVTYGYDELTRTYRTSTEDSFGYTSAAVPNHHFGTFTEITDSNGHKLVQLFDDFGRIWQVYGPNDIGSTQPTILFTYSQALVPTADSFDQPVPAWARTAHKDIARTDDTEVVTVAFVDGLARTIQTKKDLELATPNGSNIGMSVSGRVVFDERGRIAEQGQPDFRPGQGIGPDTEFIDDIDLINPTRFHYDVLARTRRVEAPDSKAPGGFAATTTDYDFGTFDGRTTFRTTLTDANGNAATDPANRHPRVTHRDIRDNIVAVEEINTIAGTDRTLVTRYAYNAVSELIGVTDAKDDVTNAAYDTVGRMVLLDNEDMGETQWRYDRSGNLAAKQTAKLRAQNQLIQYEYEFNRLSQITYPESAPVVFAYGTKDERGDAFGNIAGRIASEQSEAGLKELRYDRLGNVAEQTNTWQRIRTPDQGPYSATMRYQYDSFSRLLTMQFPGLGQEVVTYGYDRGGLVTHAFGIRSAVEHPEDPLLTFYLLNIGYDVFEQRARVIYGNGLQTDYQYDAQTRRLDRIDSNFEPLTGPPKNRVKRPFQNLRYEHDLVGNLLSITNEAPFEDQLTDVFVATTEQSFQYDKLYQLTQADGIYQDESKSRERYSLGFTYDEIGNIQVKDQASFRDLPDPVTGEWRGDFPNDEQTYQSVYTYGGPRPHAPTLITETLSNDDTRLRELSYDASGNQTGWVYHHSQTREVDFNEEDRISEVRERGQKLTDVFYDGSGARGVHVSYYGNHETAYLGQNLTIRNAVYPTKHIYAGDMLIASKLDPEWFPHPPTLYFHQDHLGSAQYATNDLQELAQHDEFLPTGEVWQAQTEGRYANRRLTSFTGKELDEGTGLYYFGARWYHPRLSQWVSPDPILAQYITRGGVFAPGQLGLYGYTRNNPVALTDPDGRRVDFKERLDESEREQLRALAQSNTDDTLGIRERKDKKQELFIAKRGSGNRPAGTALLRALIGDKKNTLTLDIVRDEEVTFTNDNAYDPIGRTLRIDPKASMKFYVKGDQPPFTQIEKAPAHIVLAHELIHPYRQFTGRTASGTVVWNWIDPNGVPLQQRINREEAEATGLTRGRRGGFTENTLRREHGLRPRAAYATPDVDFELQGVRRMCGLDCIMNP